MHLSMFSPRGRGPGIPREFDILPYSRLNFPAQRTICCVKCPPPQEVNLQCSVLCKTSTIDLYHKDYELQLSDYVKFPHPGVIRKRQISYYSPRTGKQTKSNPLGTPGPPPLGLNIDKSKSNCEMVLTYCTPIN